MKKNSFDKSNLPKNEEEIRSLIETFEFFNNATVRLQDSYQKLEKKVSSLDLELEKKNEELEQNLTETAAIRNLLNNILDSLDIAIVAINLNKEITIFNRAAEEITGHSSSEITGTIYGDIFGYVSKNEPSPVYTIKDGKEYKKIEKIIYNPTQGMIPIEYSVVPITNENDKIIGAVEAFTDLRELKKLQDQVERTKILSVLGEMAANVAHEIRNPLGGIAGYATLLERDLKADDPRRGLVKKIIEGVAGLNKIATNLLIFTRPMIPKLRAENVKQILEEVLYLTEVENEQEDKNITINRLFPNEDVFARIDPELIQQVFLNVIKNANQSMEHDGTLDVAITDTEDNMTRISIKDTGCGMNNEVKVKIFNPFFTTKPDGTGLGMAISKRIVDLHHGRIELISEPEKGTDFIIYLPK